MMDESMDEFLKGKAEKGPGVSVTEISVESPEAPPEDQGAPMSAPGPAPTCPLMEFALMALSAESSIHLFHTMCRNINLHELAGDIYEAFDAFYDDLSEQLVSLGYEVPPSLEGYENAAPGSASELSEFIKGFAAGLAENAKAFGNEGVSNVCAGFCEKLNKYVYKLDRFFEGE